MKLRTVTSIRNSASRIEHETERHTDKLNRILKRYDPDLVRLHESLKKALIETEYKFSVNLTLPTGTMHATGVGHDPLGSAKAAFAELERQVTKTSAGNSARITSGNENVRWRRSRNWARRPRASGCRFPVLRCGSHKTIR